MEKKPKDVVLSYELVMTDVKQRTYYTIKR